MRFFFDYQEMLVNVKGLPLDNLTLELLLQELTQLQIAHSEIAYCLTNWR